MNNLFRVLFATANTAVIRSETVITSLKDSFYFGTKIKIISTKAVEKIFLKVIASRIENTTCNGRISNNGYNNLQY